MSTTPQPPQPLAAVAAPASASQGPDEVRVYSHSNIFYWWPVWLVGLIMGAWTWFGDGHLMVTVPAKSRSVHAEKMVVTLPESSTKKSEEIFENVDAVILPKPSEKQTKNGILGDLPRKDAKTIQPEQPRLHVAKNAGLGVIFCAVLLLVITITNVPLRGMWSVLVIVTVALLAVIVGLLGWWDDIAKYLSLLDIRINAGGYFFLSGVLFVIWAVAVFLFDRQTYIIFQPGQFKVCQSIGDGEKVYDTVGMTLERQRGDIFRHFILGLGSGDLIVKTTGAQAHHYELPNVLFIGRKVQLIEDLLRKRKVATAGG